MSQVAITAPALDASPRGRVLAGTVLAQLGLGTIYAWGIVNPALAHRIFGDEGKVFSISITFSIMMMCLALSTLSINFLQRRFGVRKVLVACGIVLGGGLLVTAFVSQLWLLYLFAGVLVGAADGVGYLLSLTNVLRWYPDKAGAISGISVGSYGVTAVILPFILNPIIGKGYAGLTTAFIVWAIIAFLLIAGGGLLLKDAPAIPNKGTADGASEYTVKQMLHTPQAYMLFYGISLFCFAGLFIIGHGGDGALAAPNRADYLIGAGVAITLVSLIGLVNTAGRFFFGWLSDRVSRTLIVAVALAALAVFAFLLGFNWLPAPALYITGFLVFGAAFGGCITIYPTIVGEFFGKNSQAKNYSIIYQGMAVGAFITLIFNTLMAQKILTYRTAFIIGGVAIAIASVLLFIVRKPGPAPVENASVEKVQK